MCITTATTSFRDLRDALTRNYILSIHRIFIFDETKALHELDLRDSSRAMLAEMLLDIGFGRYIGTLLSAPRKNHRNAGERRDGSHKQRRACITRHSGIHRIADSYSHHF